MASSFMLDDSTINASALRAVDQRFETRVAPSSETAVMEFRGRRHVVRMGNVSDGGAMIAFPHAPDIGEHVVLQLLDRGRVSAQVRWVRDGRVGLAYVNDGGDTPQWR